MSLNEFETLIVKYFNHTISEDELKKLREELTSPAQQEYFRRWVILHYLVIPDQQNHDFEIASILQKTIKKKSFIRARTTPLLKYAAIFIFFFGITYYHFNFNGTGQELPSSSFSDYSKILPGEEKAILTIENGSSIALGKGIYYNENNVTSDGESIEYQSEGIVEDIMYNTLTIPRGGQFSLILSDGTKVWLNSETQIKYPVKFQSGQVRRVELLYGEAYFEVASSALHQGDRFQVYSEKQQIEVLGTVFNVRAYTNEDKILTTLVEGSINIQTSKVNKKLEPKEQAVLIKEREEISIQTPQDLFNEIAWQQGYFSFKAQTLEQLMQNLSRWYNVDYIFKNPEKGKLLFTGVLERESTIDDLLIYIEKTNEVQFKIEERTVKIY